jgi:hypothetical protein
MGLCFFMISPSCFWEQTIVICSAKHQRHTVSLEGSSPGHSHESRGPAEVNVTAREPVSKWDVCPWGQTTRVLANVSSRTEMELAARVPQMTAPYSAACDLSLSSDSVWRGRHPRFHHRTHRLSQVLEECRPGMSLFQVHYPGFSICSPSQFGDEEIWLIDLSHITFWKC